MHLCPFVYIDNLSVFLNVQNFNDIFLVKFTTKWFYAFRDIIILNWLFTVTMI